MIDSAINISARPQDGDTGYTSWSASVRRAVMRHDINDRTAGPIPSFGNMVRENALTAQGMQQGFAPSSSHAMAESAKPAIDYTPEKPTGDDYTFDDFIDVINPLQHLPVIGTLYRKFTGDVIKPMSNIVGGAIFGGPIGAVSSLVNVMVKEGTGKDIGENALSLAGFDAKQAAPSKPKIAYDPAPVLDEAADMTTERQLAATNLYLTSDGRRNFAANKQSSVSWNA